MRHKGTRYYFLKKDDQRCQTLDAIKDQMRIDGLRFLKVWSARRVTGTGFFHCKHFDEVGESKVSCAGCEAYKPRNGQKGICAFHFPCYEPDNEKIIDLTDETNEPPRNFTPAADPAEPKPEKPRNRDWRSFFSVRLFKKQAK